MEQKKNYALPIAMMFALFFMISFVTGLQNPMGIIIKSQFAASNLVSQLGNFANFIAYAFMGIPAGMLLTRIGYKKTALTAIAIGFVGVAITWCSGVVGEKMPDNTAMIFTVYLLGALVSGFSMCMLNTVVNPMLNTLGGGGNRGNQLIQFGGCCNSVGATIVPVLGGYLMGNIAEAKISDASPAMFIAMGIFALAFIVLASMNIPEPYIAASAEKDVNDKHSAWSFRHFVFGAVAIFFYVGIEVGIPNIGNLFMTNDLGIDPTIAGSIAGTYWFCMLIGRLVGGVAASKVSSKAMLLTVASIAVVLLLGAIMMSPAVTVSMPVFQSDISFGMVTVPACVMLLTLCGLCTSVMWGGIFNLAVEGLGKYTAAASGIFMMMVCGGGVMPLIQAKIADMTSYTGSYYLVVAMLVYLIWYALHGSKNVNKDIKVD